jgi:hypothetical protein
MHRGDVRIVGQLDLPAGGDLCVTHDDEFCDVSTDCCIRRNHSEKEMVGRVKVVVKVRGMSLFSNSQE